MEILEFTITIYNTIFFGYPNLIFMFVFDVSDLIQARGIRHLHRNDIRECITVFWIYLLNTRLNWLNESVSRRIHSIFNNVDTERRFAGAVTHGGAYPRSQGSKEGEGGKERKTARAPSTNAPARRWAHRGSLGGGEGVDLPHSVRI